MEPERRKELGSYYTAPVVVRVLTAWAMHRPRQRVMDPSCGDARFLLAAAEHGPAQLIGCDLDAEAVTLARASLRGTAADIIHGDFFALPPSRTGPVDLVIGNPPFIRYQRFVGKTRDAALRSAAKAGVQLTHLTSSWAPFLLHATHFLAEGGALAMVIPAESTQTRYGVPTLQAIARRFADTRLVTFESNLFDDVQAETYLLLADGYGETNNKIDVYSVRDLAELERLVPGGLPTLAVAADEGTLSFNEAFLLPAERACWRRVRAAAHVRRVGVLGTIANGYVSGSNAFFHCTAGEAAKRGLPPDWLRPTVRNARSLTGLHIGYEDLQAMEHAGRAHHLIVPDAKPSLAALEAFRLEGEHGGVSSRYKCRTRKPWWRVPTPPLADVICGYMIGQRPRAVVNRVQAAYTNALHGIRVAPGVLPVQLALSFYSSLTHLSLEIEGRTYGGGVLKIEPGELAHVRLPWPAIEPAELGRAAAEIDGLLRSGQYELAVARTDDLLLRQGLDWDDETIRLVRAARERLTSRRSKRTRASR